jgi:hypothetical protein
MKFANSRENNGILPVKIEWLLEEFMQYIKNPIKIIK